VGELTPTGVTVPGFEFWNRERSPLIGPDLLQILTVVIEYRDAET
jgi:hypothetical protein